MRKKRRTMEFSISNIAFFTLWCCSELWILGNAQTVYPDGGRNVIPLVRNKASRAQPYNDGTVMAHVIGSAGMNFLYYFHVLGVACENADPEFYKIVQKDFEFCINKTGPVPSDVRNQPLGSIPKPCVDWKIHRPCYKNLADDMDECLMNRPGLVKKGTDALRFTHSYAKFICGNIADTEAHLLDRYTKHDLVVDGVFQCFPHLQDRIVNCVKRDKVSKTLCSKFYIVHACFGKFYNDDNCQDVQPIYYMDDLFRNMSASLSCPQDDNEWINKEPSRPPGGGGGDGHGWSTKPPPNKGGWSSREDQHNSLPGERGRPWGSHDTRPFIRDQDRLQHHHHSHPNRGWDSHEREDRPPTTTNPNDNRPFIRDQEHRHLHHHHSHPNRGWDSHEREDRPPTTADPHANRPLPDTNWNSRPWVDVLDRGTAGMNSPPWEQGRQQKEVETTRGYSGGWSPSSTRGPTGSYQYVTRGDVRGSTSRYGENRDDFHYSTTPRNRDYAGRQSVALPPAGYAVTRTPKDTEKDSLEEKYFSTRRVGTSLASTTPTGDLGFNFYSFE